MGAVNADADELVIQQALLDAACIGYSLTNSMKGSAWWIETIGLCLESRRRADQRVFVPGGGRAIQPQGFVDAFARAMAAL